jgi:hypothetical protein
MSSSLPYTSPPGCPGLRVPESVDGGTRVQVSRLQGYRPGDFPPRPKGVRIVRLLSAPAGEECMLSSGPPLQEFPTTGASPVPVGPPFAGSGVGRFLVLAGLLVLTLTLVGLIFMVSRPA